MSKLLFLPHATGNRIWTRRQAATPVGRQRVAIEQLLHDACAVVADEARARSLSIVVVPMTDEVRVHRTQVVLVVAALLRTAIRATTSGARVAVTGQPIERQLVISVYDSGPSREPIGRFGPVIRETVAALGGKIWGAPAPHGNVVMFSLPLGDDGH